jgi:Fe-S oxidoreductase
MVDLQEKTRLCSVCYKMCRDVCSVAGATRHEADSPHNRGFFAQGIAEGSQRLTKEIVDYFFRCSMCKACREACETGMDVSEIMLAARRDLDEGLLPETVRAATPAVISGTYWGKDSPEVKKLLSGRASGADSAALLYFGQRLRSGRGDYVESALGVMDKLGAKGAVMADEPSTGQIAHFLGFTDAAKHLGGMFSEKVGKTGARKVVVFNADDLRMIQKEYPALGVTMPDIAVMSLPEYLLGLLTEKRPPLNKWDGTIVTYHDPCGLGREMRVFEAPRAIIKMAAGAFFREMALTRDKAPCCGWGMGLEVSHPEITRLMGTRQAAMAQEIGADTLVTGCPTCREVIANSLDADSLQAGGVRVIDLIQFIERVLP